MKVMPRLKPRLYSGHTTLHQRMTTPSSPVMLFHPPNPLPSPSLVSVSPAVTDRESQRRDVNRRRAKRRTNPCWEAKAAKDWINIIEKECEGYEGVQNAEELEAVLEKTKSVCDAAIQEKDGFVRILEQDIREQEEEVR